MTTAPSLLGDRKMCEEHVEQCVAESVPRRWPPSVYFQAVSSQGLSLFPHSYRTVVKIKQVLIHSLILNSKVQKLSVLKVFHNPFGGNSQPEQTQGYLWSLLSHLSVTLRNFIAKTLVLG